MQEWLISLSQNHVFWIYGFIILFACIEGPVLSMIFGVLIKLGYFDFLPIYFCLMLGDLVGDTILYYLGYHFGYSVISKFGKYVSVTERSVKKASKIFHKYKHRILIISKMTNGFGLSIAVLLTAGISRIPFSKYISLNLIGQFVWSGFLIGVGYYFSKWYLQIDGILGKMSLVAGFIILILAFIGFVKYLRNKSETI